MLQPFPGDGLEQVIEGLDLEGANRVIIVRGHEHGHGHALDADLFDDFEAAHRRHPDVEHHDVGPPLPDHAYGLPAAAAFQDGADLGIAGEERAQVVARQGLVVDDQDRKAGGLDTDSSFAGRAYASSSGSGPTGNVTTASKPRGQAGPTSRLAAAP
jgi:hypothetical protein